MNKVHRVFCQCLVVILLLRGFPAAGSIFSSASSKYFADPKVEKLASAILRNDQAEISASIKAGADVNYRGKEGVTPLWWAMRYDKLAAFDLLLSCHANPDTALDNGTCLISIAARLRTLSYLTKLVACGANVDFVGKPPKVGPDATDINPDRIPIFACIESGNRQALQILLRAKANLEIRDDLGTTPLFHALALNAYDMAFDLVVAGASLATDPGDASVASEIRRHLPRVDPSYEWTGKLIALLKTKGVDVYHDP